MASAWGLSWGDAWGVSWDNAPATVTRPSVGFPSGGRSKRYVDLKKIKAGFSRKYYDEMRAAEAAALAALKAASVRKRVEQQEALARAARAAQEALDAVQEQDTEVDLAPLTRALDAAVGAKNFATSLKRAQDAIDAAKAMMDEEEEEAIELLLMHS